MRKGKVRLSAMIGARRFHAIVLLLFAGSMQVSPVDAASISVEGDCTLAQAIESANQDRAVGGCAAGDGADTIVLTGDIALAEEPPAVTSPIIIAGGDFAISGKELFRIFLVAEDGELSIERLALRDGRSTEDAQACIEWEDGDYAAGGAICNLGALNISESVLSGNVAQFGGAIASMGTVEISGSDFNSNSANSGGAVFNWDGALTVTGSDFIGNTATNDDDLSQKYLDTHEEDDREFGASPLVYNGEGGAITSSLQGIVSIAGSSFDGNEGGLAAGAILSYGDLEIASSEFSENSAYGSGGAIVIGENTLSTITGSVFSGNSAGTGGAVDSWGILDIVDSRFVENRGGRGGAILPSGQSKVTVTRSEFSSNFARRSGGAIFNCVFCEFSVTESVFSGNSTRGRGGAIFSYGTVAVTASDFRRNRASDLGGGIMNGGELSVAGSEFYGNFAIEGGGIYNESERLGVVQQDGNTYSGNFGGDCVGCD